MGEDMPEYTVDISTNLDALDIEDDDAVDAVTEALIADERLLGAGSMSVSPEGMVSSIFQVEAPDLAQAVAIAAEGFLEAIAKGGRRGFVEQGLVQVGRVEAIPYTDTEDLGLEVEAPTVRIPHLAAAPHRPVEVGPRPDVDARLLLELLTRVQALEERERERELEPR